MNILRSPEDKRAVPDKYGLVRWNPIPGEPKRMHVYWPDPKYPVNFMVDGGMFVMATLEDSDHPFTLGLDGVSDDDLIRA